MQGKAKSQRKSASNIKLSAGGGIKFGFMKQNNISGRTLSVTDVSSYIFDTDSFASYQLRDEDTDISMIVAEGDKPDESYLALSYALKEKWFTSLFPKIAPREWLRLKPGDVVPVSADAVVAPGWLVSSYTHMLTTQGRKLDGDYRQRKVSDLAEFYSEPFEYVLLVSEDGEMAIELEKYGSNTLKAYATVYRPISDIRETTQFHKPYIVANNSAPQPKKAEPVAENDDIMTIPHEKPEESQKALALVPRPHTEGTARLLDELSVPTVPEFAKALENIATEINAAEAKEPAEAETAKDIKAPADATITELVEFALTEAGLDKPVEVLEAAPTVRSAPASTANMLECDYLLAGRVIEEAQRNKLSLADVIRKVIDLPKEIDDKVYVPFELSASEQLKLAKRYGVAENDKAAVQQKIVEELRQFAGMDE